MNHSLGARRKGAKGEREHEVEKEQQEAEEEVVQRGGGGGGRR